MLILTYIASALLLYHRNKVKHVFRLDGALLLKAFLIFGGVNVIKYLLGFVPANGADIFEMLPETFLLSVWWEDIIFVLPFALLSAKGIKNRWAMLAMLPSSLLFAMGHLYQGDIGWLTVLYPYFGWWVAKKHGFLTTVGIHIVFDVSIYLFLFGGAWA